MKEQTSGGLDASPLKGHRPVSDKDEVEGLVAKTHFWLNLSGHAQKI